MAASKRCRDDSPHASDGAIRYDDDVWSPVQHSWCKVCRQPLTRFWIDAEPGERLGCWSSWSSETYVIEEIGL